MIDIAASFALSCTGLACPDAAAASRLCAGVEGVRYQEAANVLCIAAPFDLQGDASRAVTGRDYRDGLLVVARSEGGAIRYAMDIAEHLERFRYDIVVDGICASACGQILFMAARRKVILGDGAVAMHGGPFSDEQIAAMPAAHRENIRQERDRFVGFYKKRAIGIGITNDFPQPLLERLARGEIVFWVPKAADFTRFNVTNVTWCDAKFYTPAPAGEATKARGHRTSRTPQ